MSYEKILVFDIWADYAHFKKYFTVMSPLTFSVPPRTAISGIIGAINGTDKAINPETYGKDKCLITVQIINPIKKVKITTNNIKAVSSKEMSRYSNHKPTNFEYLKNPRFRIFFSHQNLSIYESIKEKLKNHLSFYTVVLGISSCIANFEFKGEFSLSPLNCKEITEFSSVVSSDQIEEIIINEESQCHKCILPTNMLNTREVIEYREFVYDASGNNVKVRLKDTAQGYQVHFDQKTLNIMEM